jgi:peroxiredoxin
MSSRATRLARFSSVTSPNSTDVPVPREFLGPAVGAAAPDFTLRDQFGQDVTLSSFVGSKAVALVFFPWAFSNVCSSEMDGIRDRLDEFLTFDTEVLAISTDPTYSLRVFSDRDGLNFPLLSDFWPHGAVASAYGVFDPVLGVARRSSFVLDKGGIVRWSVHNELPQGRDLGDHLAQLHHLA